MNGPPKGQVRIDVRHSNTVLLKCGFLGSSSPRNIITLSRCGLWMESGYVGYEAKYAILIKIGVRMCSFCIICGYCQKGGFYWKTESYIRNKHLLYSKNSRIKRNTITKIKYKVISKSINIKRGQRCL